MAYGYDVNYGKYEDFRNKLINKRIVEWDEDKLVLDDGTVVTIECSEQDCCAGAGGVFDKVELDAMITEVSIPEVENVDDYDTIINKATVKIFHNRNIVAQAEVEADAGNGGFYYSVGSLVINDIHYRVVDA